MVTRLCNALPLRATGFESGILSGTVAKSPLTRRVNTVRTLLIGLIFVAGMFNLLLGVSYIYDPAGAASELGVSYTGPLGLATLRADFTAFFVVIGLCMLRGAWKRNGDVLLVPAALFAIAFCGRLLTLILNGTGPGFYLPMAAEAGQVILLVIGWRWVPHHKIDELTG
jgi:hypothetical protein